MLSARPHFSILGACGVVYTLLEGLGPREQKPRTHWPTRGYTAAIPVQRPPRPWKLLGPKPAGHLSPGKTSVLPEPCGWTGGTVHITRAPGQSETHQPLSSWALPWRKLCWAPRASDTLFQGWEGHRRVHGCRVPVGSGNTDIWSSCSEHTLPGMSIYHSIEPSRLLCKPVTILFKLQTQKLRLGVWAEGTGPGMGPLLPQSLSSPWVIPVVCYDPPGWKGGLPLKNLQVTDLEPQEGARPAGVSLAPSCTCWGDSWRKHDRVYSFRTFSLAILRHLGIPWKQDAPGP